jgi:hypothetical protein
MRAMAIQLGASYTIGTILNILGSFLPWSCEGDFVWVCTKGIRIYAHWSPEFKTYPWFEDNGGLVIILLSLVIVGLAARAPGFIKRPAVWSVVCAAILILASIYHIGRWILRGIEMRGVIGAPVPTVGLGFVFLGSCILLIATFRHYRRGAA